MMGVVSEFQDSFLQHSIQWHSRKFCAFNFMAAVWGPVLKKWLTPDWPPQSPDLNTSEESDSFCIHVLTSRRTLLKKQHMLVRHVLKHGSWFELVLSWSWAGLNWSCAGPTSSCSGPGHNQLRTSSWPTKDQLKPAQTSCHASKHA